MAVLIRLCAVLGLCLGMTFASAADPACGRGPRLVVDTITARPFSLVKISAQGVDPKAGLKWKVTPAKDVDKADSPRGTLQFVAPPGAYEVELDVITVGPDGTVNVDSHSVTVVIGPCCPKPPDPGPPAPPNTPPPAPPEKGGGKLDAPAALAKIQFPPYGCTATVIGPRRPDGTWDLVSANHCISHVGVGGKGSAVLPSGKKFGITVTVRDPKCDISWLVTDEVIEDLPYANLAAKNPPVGTPIWHAGYGVDKPGNREDGSVTGDEDSNGQLKMSISVSSGDSGGGMFRTDTNELIATVCCTMAKAQRSSVWGGSVEQARRLRPRAGAAEDIEWAPMEIPLVEIRR